ncbi:MAG: glycoside hydrolase, partial [Chloroflexi bacterium]
ALDAYCRERFIELVPNQNSFGHMERWLPLPEYAALAETHDTFTTPWGSVVQGPFSLAPDNPGSIKLITGLYDELLPNFTSRMFNVGLDETSDLGQGVSKSICEARGRGQVYFDFLMKIYSDVKRRGYTMLFWGDIINNESPELAALLPRDVIALNWGYDWDHPFDVQSQRFASSGVPFYVCPGTSTWCSLAGRTDNALTNLLNAAENGIKHGAIGYLNTDWGDAGHWQSPPVSYLGFAAGAAFSWALEANRSMDVPAVVSRFAFADPTGSMGKLAYDLGNIYQAPGIIVPNGSALFWALQLPLDAANAYAVQVSKFHETIHAVDAAMQPLSSAKMARPDADLIRREYLNTARLLRHAARRVILAVEGDHNGLCKELAADIAAIIEEYRALWLARSRPGGLADSAGRLEAAAASYK